MEDHFTLLQLNQVSFMTCSHVNLTWQPWLCVDNIPCVLWAMASFTSYVIV